MKNNNTHVPPPLAKLLLKRMTIYNERHSIVDDFNDTFQEIYNADGISKAKYWYWINVLKSFPEYFRLLAFWRTIMFTNYLKIAFRNITKHRLFSTINIVGLAIGMAVCMIILLWVQRETSFDHFHKNANRIYRIERELFRDNFHSRWPITSGAYKQSLEDDYPEIEHAVRFWRREFSIKDRNNVVHRQTMFAVDNSIFDIFDFRLERGDPNTALAEPRTVVLTRENAFRYFGAQDAMGQSLSFEWNNELVDFEVTGILENVPGNSHIQFDMLLSISSYPDDRFGDWRSNYLYTYVLAKENTSKGELEEKLRGFVSQRLEPFYGDLLGQGLGIHKVLKMQLFPLTDIHLHPSVNWEMEAGGNIASIYIFSSVAVFILLIACINFMNLSTALASKRAKEVGLRKTVGASQIQLKAQFIQESLLLALLSSALALIFMAIFIPIFNNMFNENLVMNMLLQIPNVLFFIGITFAVGLLAGLYPASYLTKFEPVSVLKGAYHAGRGKTAFRRSMVVLQFAVSITLLIGMFIVYNQMEYIQTKSLGFDKTNLVILPVRSRQAAQNYETFRNELMISSKIVSVGASSNVPTDEALSNTSFSNRHNSDDSINLIYMTTDYHFVNTYRLEVLEGRAFSREFETDTTGTIILNEAAAQRIGWAPKDAIGEVLLIGNSNRATKVVGVVKNFNYKSLRREIEPLALLLYPTYVRAISVRIRPGHIGESLKFIQKKWSATFPGERFEYSFLDNRINMLYENETKMKNIFIMFSSFSIFVACLGLFGLAAFTASERTKEIGIRKVLGASTSNVLYLMSKELLTSIIFANLVAWPLAWFTMDKWMQNFAYKTSIEWHTFFIAGGLALLIGMFTLSFQSIKAAYANPVDALKYE